MDSTRRWLHLALPAAARVLAILPSAPSGMHAASDADLNALISQLSNSSIASGSLLFAEHELGLSIDAHNIVVRVNDAPTVGFERFVGSRTDIRIVRDLKYRVPGETKVLARCARTPKFTPN
jgi:hypothetical protein